MSDMSDWNDKVIAEFRENDGTTARFGRHLVVLHTVGAKTGEARPNPVRGFQEGDGWLVAASYAGQAIDPAWAHNLRAHPELDVEVATDAGVQTVAVRATELPRAERDAAWVGIVAEAPGFADYEKQTDRVIPVFRLTPRS
jgi:deazaflavin-dependent oxidoreductase (nitroreductase family)